MPLMIDPRRRRMDAMGMDSRVGTAGPSGWGTMDAVPSTNMARPTDIAGVGMAGGNMAFPQPPRVFSDIGMAGGNMTSPPPASFRDADMTGVAGPSSIASQFSQAPPTGGPGSIAQRLRRGGYAGVSGEGVAPNPRFAPSRPGRDVTRRF